MKKRAITGTITMMDEESGSMPQVYYAKVQVKILRWWVTIKTIIDLCPRYPETLAKFDRGRAEWFARFRKEYDPAEELEKILDCIHEMLKKKKEELEKE